MVLKNRIFQYQQLWLLGVLGAALATGCNGAPVGTSQNGITASPETSSTGESAALSTDAATPETGSDRSLPVPIAGVARSPQLIKHASLQIVLPDVDDAIATISTIVAQHQGDVLQLSISDYKSDRRTPPQASLQLRVPQAQLDAALASLRDLGTVTSQSSKAEDVSTQLVDLRARLRNLQQSEAALLEIMERSGSIADVLEVNRELSSIRETIERHDAQLKSLQNRVAYSTISLTLVSTQVSVPPEAAISDALSQTWTAATSSVKALSIALLRLSLWLLAFSPYIGVLVVTGWAVNHHWTRQRRINNSVTPDEAG
jgi:hypothetical protein